MPRLTFFARHELSIVALLAKSALIALFSVRDRTLLAKSFTLGVPVPIRHPRHHWKLLFAEVALYALFAGELTSCLQTRRGLI